MKNTINAIMISKFRIFALLLMSPVLFSCTKGEDALAYSDNTPVSPARVTNPPFVGTFSFVVDATTLTKSFIVRGSGGTVDFGDGVQVPFTTENITHTYAASGTYTINVLVTTPTAVSYVNISNTEVKSITGLSNLPNLTTLTVAYNKLTSVDITGNAALINFFGNNNQFSGVDFSHNPALAQIWLFVNAVTSLNTSNNPLLHNLRVYGNRLTSLNISNNAKLLDIRVFNNNLSTSELNGLLVSLDVFGLSHGNFEANSQIPAVPLSNAGVSAKTNLQSKSWTVSN